MTLLSLHEPTIVVPVDFDEPSKRAVSLALALARPLDARVVLLHVVPPTNLPEGTRLLPTDASEPVDLGVYVSERARKMLDEYFLALFVSGVAVRKEVRTGHVVETLLRGIEESEAALVVVGTHGRKGAQRVMLGSVAEGLIRRSPVPVMVAKDDERPRHHDATFTGAALASGAVAGAATGALGGPLGVAVGGAIGTIVGGVVGAVIAREDARTQAHDRSLDDDIGVTHGSLGTPTETKQPSPEVVRDNLDRS